METEISIPKIESLISSNLSGEKRKALMDKFKVLSKKISDSKLYLAIVGEFSSGKSTFINALLRKHLLKEAVRPTTATATFIERAGTDLTIDALFDDNNHFSATENDNDELSNYIQRRFKIACNSFQELIDSLTSIQDVARFVKELYINIPDANIPQGIVLIDTPGFNPGDEVCGNHFEITKYVVENVADMALILMPSEQTMSASIKEFMEKSLAQYLHRCKFIVTKGDNLLPSEREVVVDFLNNQLCSSFNLHNPKIYIESSISSLPVVNIPESKKMEWGIWKERFASFEQETWKSLAQQKETIVAEHTNTILGELIVELRKTLQNEKEELINEQNVLKQGRIEHIEVITNQLLSNSQERMAAIIAKIKGDIASQITTTTLSCQSFTDDTINAVTGGMYDFETNEKVIIENEVKSRCSKMIKSFNSKQISWLNKEIDKIIKNLQTQFEQHYSVFPALHRNVTIKEISISNIAISSLSFSTSSFIEKEESKEKKAFGAGAIIGGVLGFLVGGPVGAAIGTGVGLFGGASGNTVDEKKAGVKEILKKDIHTYFKKISTQITKMINNRSNQISKELNQLCIDHIQKYGDSVEKLIAEHQETEKKLSKRVNKLHTDINYLEDCEEFVKSKLLELKYI